MENKTRKAYDQIRSEAKFLKTDRKLHEDITKIFQPIDSPEFLDFIWRED